MPAMKWLLLLFSVALVGLSSAQLTDDDYPDEDSVQNIEDEENSEDPGIVAAPNVYKPDCQDSEEEQENKSFGKYQCGYQKHGHPGPPGYDVSGSSIPGSPLDYQKGGHPGAWQGGHPGGPRGRRSSGPRGSRPGSPQGGRPGGPQRGRPGGPQGGFPGARHRRFLGVHQGENLGDWQGGHPGGPQRGFQGGHQEGHRSDQ